MYGCQPSGLDRAHRPWNHVSQAMAPPIAIPRVVLVGSIVGGYLLAQAASAAPAGVAASTAMCSGGEMGQASPPSIPRSQSSKGGQSSVRFAALPTSPHYSKRVMLPRTPAAPTPTARESCHLYEPGIARQVAAADCARAGGDARLDLGRSRRTSSCVHIRMATASQPP